MLNFDDDFKDTPKTDMNDDVGADILASDLFLVVSALVDNNTFLVSCKQLTRRMHPPIRFIGAVIHYGVGMLEYEIDFTFMGGSLIVTALTECGETGTITLLKRTVDYRGRFAVIGENNSYKNNSKI